MASTVFQPFITPITSVWLNDVNVTVYTALGSAGVAPTTAAQVIANLSLLTTTVATSTYLTQANATSTYAPLISPTLTTPNLGTPSAGVLTNCTGTAAGLSIGGNAATATNATTAATVSTTVASGAVGTTQAIGDNSTKIATTAYADRRPVMGTPVQVTSSPTSVSFTGIPSWAKKITLSFIGWGTSSTSAKIVQVGSGSTQASGYLGSGGDSATQANSTSAFTFDSVTAADRLHGSLTLSLLDSTNNIWAASGVVGASNSAQIYWCAGSCIVTGGSLDRVIITSANGSDTLVGTGTTANTINIMYE